MFKGGLRKKGIYKTSLPGKPLITVVTVVLNNKRYIEDAISSVLGQTYDNVEYIVIDGGSTDGTLDVIKKYGEKIDYWISSKDKGIYDAMNKGTELARGDWIHLLNSDDYYFSSDVLEKAVGHLDNSGDNFYYFTLIHQFPSQKKKTYKYPFNFLGYLRLYYSAYLPHPTLFVMKKQYEEIGPYDLNFKIAADHDMILRLCKKYRPCFVDIPLSVMRIRGYSSKDLPKTFEDFRRVTVKNGLNHLLAGLILKFKVFKYKLTKN